MTSTKNIIHFDCGKCTFRNTHNINRETSAPHLDSRPLNILKARRRRYQRTELETATSSSPTCSRHHVMTGKGSIHLKVKKVVKKITLTE
jgi:hypothetical protein